MAKKKHRWEGAVLFKSSVYRREIMINRFNNEQAM